MTRPSDSNTRAIDPAVRPTNYYRLIKRAINLGSRALDAFAAQYGLTGSQMSIIDYLSTCPGYASGQGILESEFDVQGSTLTVMLQRMEAKGLLERVSSPEDARKKIVRLSPKSERLIPIITAYIDQEQLRFEQVFTPEQLSAFERMLSFVGNPDEFVDQQPPL
ncbi:MarR family transcriptional regulator [Bombiscardovia apis]|uniref:MarR family transcriptional regulator n=1 Tax=Bombiscardovia apis TaxID=2932182 RepID=A0ABN6SEX4_9BIFI|nr:MarR family winged helix-turn-helix transcriptional regulator [Bombiscardovia apis]BDR54088.1 MarR family transcriptional regulator [Bombiscardovia apis]